jgi:hypothetical protein
VSELPAEEAASLADVTGMTLERIRQLCAPSAGLDPDHLTGRPVLREALLRLWRETEQGEESFAGFNDNPF